METITIKVRLKGVLISLFYSVPLGWLVWFILSNVQEIESGLVPKAFGVLIVLVFSFLGYISPAGFIKSALLFLKIWGIGVAINSLFWW